MHGVSHHFENRTVWERKTTRIRRKLYNGVVAEKTVTHYEAREERFNEQNWGLGYVWDSGVTIGAYRNSLDRNSAYLGYDYSSSYLPWFHVKLGVISGYDRTGLNPMIIPSLQVPVYKKVGLETLFIPRVANKTPATLGMSVVWRL